MSVTDEQTALAKARLKARNLARVVREQQATIERLEAQVRERQSATETFATLEAKVREQTTTIGQIETSVRELRSALYRGGKVAVPQGTWDAESAGTDVPRADTQTSFPSSPHDSKSQTQTQPRLQAIRVGDTANAVTRDARPKGRGGSQARGTRGTDTSGGARPGGKVSGTRRDRAGGAKAPIARDGAW